MIIIEVSKRITRIIGIYEILVYLYKSVLGVMIIVFRRGGSC